MTVEDNLQETLDKVCEREEKLIEACRGLRCSENTPCASYYFVSDAKFWCAACRVLALIKVNANA